MKPGRRKARVAPVPAVPSTPPLPSTEAPDQPEPLWRRMLREPVALGLTPLIVLRPWLDGITYPAGNFYFVWGVTVMACLFLVRMLVNGAEPRFKWCTGLLAGFWLVGVLTFAITVQYDATYRAVVIWAGYLFLFVAVINGVRTRLGVGIVLAALLSSMFIESAYSLFHYHYILPLVRESVLRDPQMVSTRFGTSISNAELAHRLQVNRAFGSLLFPNALAAILILSLPVAVSQALIAIRSFWKNPTSRPSDLPRGWQAFVTTAAVWIAVAVVCHVIAEWVGLFEYPPAREMAWRHGPLVRFDDGSFGLAGPDYIRFWSIITLGVPTVVAGLTCFILKIWGFRTLWLSMRIVLLPMLVVIEAVALWLTYSRGGMLAIAGATALCMALAFVAKAKIARNCRKAGSVAAVLILVALMPAMMGQGPPAPAPAQTASAPAPAISITKEGINLTAADLMNPASFRLRLTYWHTGLRMALDNFWTGVGLGNFGTVYPNYMVLKSGEVKAAHNDYLQALCETGILGFLLFVTFWASFMWWGALRICRETGWSERWTLIGLYGGVTAFLAHSLVDFDFFNPALSFFAFLTAALFVSQALITSPEPAGVRKTGRGLYQVAALPSLLAAALICGMGLRVYMADLIIGGYEFFTVGDNKKMEQTYSDGQFFFQLPSDSETRAEVIPKKHLGGLLPEREDLQAVGNYLVREGNPPKIRLLDRNEPIPPNAFFAVADREKVKQQVLPYVDRWLGLLQRADKIYPYNARQPAYFMKWYDLLVNSLPDGEDRRRYVLEYAKWAQEAVARSPREFQYRTALGKAMWLRANIEPAGASRQRFFKEGLESYKRAMELYPASPDTTRGYARTLMKYGQALIRDAGQYKSMAEEGARLVKEGEQLLRRADQMEQDIANG